MKKVFFVSFCVSLLVVVGLCSGSFAAERGSIKVGFLCPLSGPWAEVGKDMANGFNMYMEEVGFKAAGREIVVVREDTRATPETAVTKLRKVVSHDKVAVVGGIITAPSGLATAAAADELQIPLIIACAAGNVTPRG